MIDWNNFNNYLQSYDKDLVLKLIDMFIRDYPDNMRAMKEIVEKRDFARLDSLAHNLKSNCGLFGGIEAAELALKLEMMGKEIADYNMDVVYERFVSASEELVQELKLYRKEAG
jgi:HPt (histidine-containing phosphotransfer) domain-containing protein